MGLLQGSDYPSPNPQTGSWGLDLGGLNPENELFARTVDQYKVLLG